MTRLHHTVTTHHLSRVTSCHEVSPVTMILSAPLVIASTIPILLLMGLSHLGSLLRYISTDLDIQ